MDVVSMMTAKYRGKIGNISVKSEYEVDWTVENFSSYTEKDDCYESPNFYYSSFLSLWTLYICPNGQTSKDSVGWISLSLRYNDDFDDEHTDEDDDDDDSRVGACITFGVRKADGTVEKIKSELRWRSCHIDDIVFPKFIERSILLERKSELVPSDSLTFTFTMRSDERFEPSVGLDNLSQNFVDLLTSKRDCDVTLKVMSVEFPVHKLILCARSQVFAAMFEADDMKEKRTGLVRIEDCDPETFREFLVYLYSGKLEKNPSNADELHRIAHKYDIPDLRSYVHEAIVCDIAIADADLLVFGEKLDHFEVSKFRHGMENLSQIFADLLTSKKGCDVTLDVEGVEFPVHKLILGARSPVFAAMFEVDMKEKRTGLVRIEDCDPQAFGEFLEYLYSGKLELISSNAIELYRIADKYDIQDLRSYCCKTIMSEIQDIKYCCCETIMSDLTFKNVLDAVMLGRHFDHFGVSLKSREFFKINSQKITSSTQWAQFLSENADVAHELLNLAAQE